MNTLLVFTLACLASAYASGHGVVISGPSGVVTGHGPVGAGYGGYGSLGGYGGWGGNGGWGDHGGYSRYGGWGNGAWGGHGGYGGWGQGGYSDAIIGHGVAVVGPSASGYGTWNGALGGHGQGVAIVGPATVPATIVGPSGKIVADGLYGVGHGHGYSGHW